jgi:hypothetical protein
VGAEVLAAERLRLRLRHRARLARLAQQAGEAGAAAEGKRRLEPRARRVLARLERAAKPR